LLVVALGAKVRRALLTWRKTHFFLGKVKSAPKVWQISRRFDKPSKPPHCPDFISGLRFAVESIVVALGAKVRRALSLTKHKSAPESAPGI
jgi:hypothetical protein